MKSLYALHPSEYALGETEKFYADKAAAGWALVTRGVYFDRFEKTKPRLMKYRIEVAVPKMFEDPGLPQEQVMVYEDCGWEYVTFHRYIHVFRAPLESDTEDFYLDAEGQAKTIKGLKNQYIGSFIYPFLMLALYIWLGSLTGAVSKDMGTALFGVWMVNPAVLILLGLLITVGLYDSFVGMWYITRLYHRMKKGILLDHAPKKRRVLHKIIHGAAAVGLIACAVIGISQLCSHQSYELPTEREPYLLLSDFGVSGEHTESYMGRDANVVKYKKSLFLEYWDSFESVKTEDGSEWFFQDTFRLKDKKDAYRFARSLMADSAHAREMSDFKEVKIEGLDYAWTVGIYEYVAIKGNLVTTGNCSINFEMDMTELLEILAAHWNE